MMELAAAHLAQADYNLGRVLDAIDDLGQTDNTLVIYIVGDNGAAGEGSLQGSFNDMNVVAQSEETLDYKESRLADFGTWKSSNLYPVAWAWAMNTPFQWTKQVASHFGGTRNGMVVSWPKGIKARGEIRSQFHHVIDIVPTILEAAGLPQPVDGERRDPAPDRGRQPGLHLRRRRGRGPPAHAVLRDLRQLRGSITTAGSPRPRRCGCRGAASAPTWTC